MAKGMLPRPTDAELAILRVLWREGPSSVRQVRDVMERSQPTGYTTVLKLLQIMTEKGLVARDESERTHVYRASRSEVQTQRQLVSDLVAPGLRRLGTAPGDAGARDQESIGRGTGGDSQADREPRTRTKRRRLVTPWANRFGPELVERMGWCLVHSVWEGAAVAW